MLGRDYHKHSDTGVKVMVQSDVSFTIHASTETLTAISALNSPSEINNLTRGDTATFTFRFAGDSLTAESLVVETNDTHTVATNTTEIYTQTDVKENGQLNVQENGTLNVTGGDNRDTLQEYADHAGAFASQTTLNNTQLYREQIPTNADIGSIVLGIEPSTTLQNDDIEGIWGIVTGGSDMRNQALSNDQFQIELRVLAEYSEYADHTAISNDLEV